MDAEREAILSVAHKLRLSTAAESNFLLKQSCISTVLRQDPPYLSLLRALVFTERNIPSAVLAEAHFAPKTCEGHYPGYPSVPLVDMGRVMSQAAALLACDCTSPCAQTVPLARCVTRIRAESSMEMYRSSDTHWIWSTVAGGKITTRFYSGQSTNMLATIDGWEFDLLAPPYPADCMNHTDSETAGETNSFHCNQSLDTQQIMNRIPQVPPFLILKQAHKGITRDGVLTVRSFSRMPLAAVQGYIAERHLLSVMHYARALAQTGMLLSAFAAESKHVDGIPEVMSGKNLWCDTQMHFGPENDMVALATLTGLAHKAGHTFVTLQGTVFVCGRPVFKAENFTYVLIPKDQHPTRLHKGAPS